MVLKIDTQSVVFSDHTNLNLLVEDLMEEGALSITLEGDTAKEFKGATGTAMLTTLYQRGKITLRIVAVSPKAQEYKRQVESSATLLGQCTITDASATPYVFSNLRLQNKGSDVVSSGYIEFDLLGDYAINKDVIVGF